MKYGIDNERRAVGYGRRLPVVKSSCLVDERIYRGTDRRVYNKGIISRKEISGHKSKREVFRRLNSVSKSI